MNPSLLDVAVGPIYLILGLGFLLIVGLVALITVFVIKTIRKLKHEEEQDN